MSRQIIFAREARIEFEEAFAWYEEQQAGLGNRFEAAVDETLQHIARNPELFRLISPKTRKARVKVFANYVIYFEVESTYIGIIAVFHGSRNPAELRRRLK